MFSDMIDLALELTQSNTRRPKQVHLRRAVSTAYYGLFHYLTDQSCRSMFGSQHSQQPYRNALSRTFSHTVMKEACKSFGGGNLKESLTRILPTDSQGNYIIPPEIQEIANLFVDLQEKRHIADYNQAERFVKSDVISLINQTKTVHSKFESMNSFSDERKFFLSCLLVWKELKNR